ncbi:GWxTD domain-containing protein [Pontibacter harenae]|uniref:GWxTD domain-containing protein n=1 Tax=Pontibacter harenae TaxID=2894083 RepID=UPI001E50092A|nr:GWxTD domain-containing protein [Pontibacter harenae]MCC9168478.1 GWxTD domain-containing protein [Pontibacter harenae]
MRRLFVLPELAVIVLLLLVSSCATSPPPVISQNVSSANTVRPELAMQHEFYAANDSLYLYFKFEDLQQVLDLAATAKLLEYSIRQGSTEQDPALMYDSVPYISQLNVEANGHAYYSVQVPGHLIAQPNYLHMRLWQESNDGLKLGTYFALPLSAQMLEKSYLFRSSKTGRPLFRNYLNLNESLIVTKAGETDTLEVSLLDAAFAPAAPPMAVRPEPAPKTIQIAERFYYADGDTLSFPRKGIYLVEPNASGSKGILVQDGSYPQVTMAQELIYPLVYITTSNEREALLNAPDAKLALDNFWLKVAGNDEINARNLIRQYYGRVETANRLYTSHKEGWATDRGMIYIIYGKPSRVTSTRGSEVWTYRESPTQPYVKFVFNKKENTFTENHYELVRNPNYKENWYSTVAKWRAGITDM